MSDELLGQIYWRCRRGMWELDLYLIPFFKQRYTALDPAEQAGFIQLLDCPDPDIHAWLNGSREPDPQVNHIIQRIRTYAIDSDKSQVF